MPFANAALPCAANPLRTPLMPRAAGFSDSSLPFPTCVRPATSRMSITAPPKRTMMPAAVLCGYPRRAQLLCAAPARLGLVPTGGQPPPWMPHIGVWKFAKPIFAAGCDTKQLHKPLDIDASEEREIEP